MRHEFRVRKRRIIAPAPPGVVEVRVRRDDIGDLFRREPFARQHVERVRDRV